MADEKITKKVNIPSENSQSNAGLTEEEKEKLAIYKKMYYEMEHNPNQEVTRHENIDINFYYLDYDRLTEVRTNPFSLVISALGLFFSAYESTMQKSNTINTAFVDGFTRSIFSNNAHYIEITNEDPDKLLEARKELKKRGFRCVLTEVKNNDGKKHFALAVAAFPEKESLSNSINTANPFYRSKHHESTQQYRERVLQAIRELNSIDFDKDVLPLDVDLFADAVDKSTKANKEARKEPNAPVKELVNSYKAGTDKYVNTYAVGKDNIEFEFDSENSEFVAEYNKFVTAKNGQKIDHELNVVSENGKSTIIANIDLNNYDNLMFFAGEQGLQFMSKYLSKDLTKKIVDRITYCEQMLDEKDKTIFVNYKTNADKDLILTISHSDRNSREVVNTLNELGFIAKNGGDRTNPMAVIDMSEPENRLIYAELIASGKFSPNITLVENVAASINHNINDPFIQAKDQNRLNFGNYIALKEAEIELINREITYRKDFLSADEFDALNVRKHEIETDISKAKAYYNKEAANLTMSMDEAITFVETFESLNSKEEELEDEEFSQTESELDEEIEDEEDIFPSTNNIDNEDSDSSINEQQKEEDEYEDEVVIVPPVEEQSYASDLQNLADTYAQGEAYNNSSYEYKVEEYNYNGAVYDGSFDNFADNVSNYEGTDYVRSQQTITYSNPDDISQVNISSEQNAQIINQINDLASQGQGTTVNSGIYYNSPSEVHTYQFNNGTNIPENMYGENYGSQLPQGNNDPSYSHTSNSNIFDDNNRINSFINDSRYQANNDDYYDFNHRANSETSEMYRDIAMGAQKAHIDETNARLNGYSNNNINNGFGYYDNQGNVFGTDNTKTHFGLHVKDVVIGAGRTVMSADSLNTGAVGTIRDTVGQLGHIVEAGISADREHKRVKTLENDYKDEARSIKKSVDKDVLNSEEVAKADRIIVKREDTLNQYKGAKAKNDIDFAKQQERVDKTKIDLEKAKKESRDSFNKSTKRDAESLYRKESDAKKAFTQSMEARNKAYTRNENLVKEIDKSEKKLDIAVQDKKDTIKTLKEKHSLNAELSSVASYKAASDKKLRDSLTRGGVTDSRRFYSIKNEAIKQASMTNKERAKRTDALLKKGRISNAEATFLKEQSHIRNRKEMDKASRWHIIPKGSLRDKVFRITGATGKAALGAVISNSGDAGQALALINRSVNKTRRAARVVKKISKEYRKAYSIKLNNKRARIEAQNRLRAAQGRPLRRGLLRDRFTDKARNSRIGRAAGRLGDGNRRITNNLNRRVERHHRRSEARKRLRKYNRRQRFNNSRLGKKINPVKNKFKKIGKTFNKGFQKVSAVGRIIAKPFAFIGGLYNKVKEAIMKFLMAILLKLFGFVCGFALFCFAIDIIVGALTTGWGAIVDFYNSVTGYSTVVENVYTDTPLGFTAMTLLWEEDVYYKIPVVCKGLYQGVEEVANVVSWVPILSDLVDKAVQDAEDNVTQFERNIWYSYVPKDPGFAHDASSDNLLLVSIPNEAMSITSYADASQFNYVLALNQGWGSPATDYRYLYVTLDRNLSGVNSDCFLNNINTGVTPEQQLIIGSMRQCPYPYPYYKYNIADALITEEASGIMYFDEKGALTGRVSNIKQILAMTSVVFDNTDDEDIANGEWLADSENDNKAIIEVWVDNFKILKQVYDNFADGFDKIVVDLIKKTGINLPDVLFNKKDYNLTTTEIRYATAAYWASHEVYMSYAATPDGNIALDPCGATINRQVYEPLGLEYNSACKYIYFNFAHYSGNDDRGNSFMSETRRAAPYGFFMSGNYGYISELEIASTTTGKYGAYDTSSATLESALVKEFYQSKEEVVITNAAGTYKLPSSAANPLDPTSPPTKKYDDKTIADIKNFMSHGSCFNAVDTNEANAYSSSYSSSNYTGYYVAPGGQEVPCRVDGSYVYVGNGYYTLFKEYESNFEYKDASSGAMVPVGAVTLIYCGNFVEKMMCADGGNFIEFDNFIEFALAESIRTKGNDHQTGNVFSACTGHPRAVFVLQTYTFGLDGTYLDDGNFSTTYRDAPVVNGHTVKTLFDKVDESPTCERIERKFAKFGVAYQGWQILQSPTDTLVNLYMNIDSYLDEANNPYGTLITWPKTDDSNSIEGANRDRARTLYDKDWSTEYGFNISDSAFFNKVMLSSEQKTNIVFKLFKNFAETGVDIDENGDPSPRFQPIVSDERYEIIWSALDYVGKISFLENASLTDYVTSSGDGVRLNAGGHAATPSSLGSASFVTWLYASRGMCIYDGNTGNGPDGEITWDDLYNSPNVSSSTFSSSGMLCPGDIISYLNDKGERRGGIFLYYYGSSHSYGYIIEMVDHGNDDNLSIFDGDLSYDQSILDLATQRVGCVSLSLVNLTNGHWRIRPKDYNGKTFLPGCAVSTMDDTNLGGASTTSSIIDGTTSTDLEDGDFRILED